MSGLVLYDRMVTAIAECERVDEAKDIRDKAAALQVYYHQAGNFDAERKAANVRIRAERRVGELLKQLARASASEAGKAGGFAKAGVSNGATCQSPFADALKTTGISRQKAARFQKLAEVPEDEFELALSNAPTRAAKRARKKVEKAREEPPLKVGKAALALWGWLREFERVGHLDADPSEMLAGMTVTMVEDTARLAPLIIASLTTLEKEARNHEHLSNREGRNAAHPRRDAAQPKRERARAGAGVLQ